MDSNNLILYNLTPDLLDRDALTKILKDRYIDLPNMNTMSKDVLVELFHRVVAPLPQRTRCGEQPQHTQLLQQSQGFSIGFSGATSSSSVNTTCSRLKPPPIVCSTQKTVRLSTAKSQCSSHMDNIIINDRSKKSTVQHEVQKSRDDISFVPINRLNVLDKIVINDRTKVKVIPEGIQPSSNDKKEHISNPSNSVTDDAGRNVDQSLNLLKPRIKLKRSSLSASSSLECTAQLVEPQIKKPKTKIVF